MSFRSIAATALLGIVAVTGACASSSAKGFAADGGCALLPQDSTFAMVHQPLYRECGVEKKVQKISANITPDWQRPSGAASRACYSAEVEFVVTAEGKPDAATARVVRTTTPSLAEALLSIIPRYRYEPAKRDGVAVAQITTEKYQVQTMTVVVPAGTRPGAGTMPRPGPGC
jgi:hypothetical protein